MSAPDRVTVFLVIADEERTLVFGARAHAPARRALAASRSASSGVRSM